MLTQWFFFNFCYPIKFWQGTTFTVLAMVLYDVEAYWPARTSRWEMPWRRASGLEARSPIVRAPLARGTFVIKAILREHQVLVTPCSTMQHTKIINTDHSWQVLSRDSKNVSFFSLSIIEMQNLWDLHVLKLRWSWQWWKCNKYVVHSEKKKY